MKQILKQVTEINHLRHAEIFRNAAREHPRFSLPLQLRSEPIFIPISSGELLLLSEYVSNGMSSLLLNVYYVHKYVDNSWIEILTIPHAEKVRVHGNTIYAITELKENQYRVCQYDLDGHLIQHCIIENEPETQINLDSIYFSGNRVVYCYQYFLEQIPYFDREKYTSCSRLEWREDTDKNLLSVYAFSTELKDEPRLYNQSLNTCGLKVRWRELNGGDVHDKDLGIKSFHQIVTLLHGDVMQICYTEPDPIWIKPENEYEYYVCFVFPDGTIQDCAQAIPKGRRPRFNMERQFSETTPNSIFYAIDEEIVCVYEIKKGELPKEVYCTNGASTFSHCHFFHSKGNREESSACIKFARDTAQKYKEFRDKNPIPPLSKKEKEEFTNYLRDCGNGKYREKLESLFDIDLREKDISKMKISEDESPLRVYGTAYGKIFVSTCLKNADNKHSDTSSALFYYDTETEQGVLVDADSPHKRYVIGSVTDQHFSYLSGYSALRMGYKQARIICRSFSGELLGELSIDSKDPCIGAIEHQGIIHVLTKNKVAFKTRQEMPPTILTFSAYSLNG